MLRKILAITLILLAGFAPGVATSQEAPAPAPAPATGVNPDFLANSLLQDLNGDGELRIVAFGDSITKGVGDFLEPGADDIDVFIPIGEAGYPLRMENLAQISVRNLGAPGEELTLRGVPRFAAEIPAIRPDLVFIMEGANDAFQQASAFSYFSSMQTLINITRAIGATPVIITLPPFVGNHSNIRPYTDIYNNRLIELVSANGAEIADSLRAYNNTCIQSPCELFNLPEGLHPNSVGYDVLAETVLATVLGVDLFAPEGPANLEIALNLPAGSVTTKPDFVPPPPPAE